MMREQRFSNDFITAWANVLASIRNGELEKSLALDRIDCIIPREKDPVVRRFLKKMKQRIRWMKVRQ